MSSSRIRTKTRLIRTALVAVGLVLWFATQSLIGSRELGGDPDGIETAGRVLSRGDALFGLTAAVNRYLNEHSRAASALLIVSSLLIDLLAVFVILHECARGFNLTRHPPGWEGARRTRRGAYGHAAGRPAPR